MTNTQLNFYCDKQVTALTPFLKKNEARENKYQVLCMGFISIAKVPMNWVSPQQRLLSQSILFTGGEYISLNTEIIKHIKQMIYLHML